MEWANQTTLHPLGLLAIVILGAVSMLVSRRVALVPLLLMACFAAPAQRIVVLGFDFNFMRIMVLFGLVRLLVNNEIRVLVWKPIDSMVCLWAVSGTVIAVIYHSTWSIVVFRLGVMFDVFGMYFLTRCVIRDWEDISTLARYAALISLPVAAVFVFERATGRNMFHIFGGVPEFTVFRDTRRCQGAFAHAILAGTFWAVLGALIATLWWRRDRARYLGVLGVLASGVIIYCTGSSTPIWAAVAAVIGFCVLPLRRHLWWLRAGAVMGLVMLQLVMNNPLWHLMSRVDVFTRSQGWYRFKVIDEFVRHVDEWWLLGTDGYAEWFRWGLEDLTNQYVLEGVNGGLLSLALFIAMIAVAFVGIGRAQRQLGGPPAGTTPARRSAPLALTWGLGVALLVHCVAFLGVSYFGQIVMLWYMTLGMIGSIAPSAADRRVPRMVLRAIPHRRQPAVSEGPTS